MIENTPAENREINGSRGGSAPKHKWDNAEREIIRREYEHTRASRRRIAAKLGVTEYGVAGQITQLGIAKRTGRRPWTPDQDKQLEDLIPRNSTRQIAKLMHRSINSVTVRAKRLGLHRRDRDGWYTKREICEILGVDHKWVQSRIDSGALDASYHHGHRPQKNGMACWHIEERDIAKFIRRYCHDLNGRNGDLMQVVQILVAWNHWWRGRRG